MKKIEVIDEISISTLFYFIFFFSKNIYIPEDML